MSLSKKFRLIAVSRTNYRGGKELVRRVVINLEGNTPVRENQLINNSGGGKMWLVRVQEPAIVVNQSLLITAVYPGG